MKTALLFAAFALLFGVRLGAAGVIDYDEAAYAQAAHEMLARGDWLAPTLNGEPFFEKPPLLYWGQLLGYRVFGVGALGARAGNALAALAALAALYGFSRRPLGPRVARLGVLVLGSSLAFVSLARVALTDIWLLLWILLALGCFERALERAQDGPRGGARWFVAACACAGLAMLTKGAVGALLPLAAGFLQLAALGRLRLLLRPAWCLPGAAALLGIGLSWTLLLGATQPGGFAFLQELVVEHQLGRFASPKEGHRGPLLYYLPVIFLALAPWSAFLPLASIRRFDAASERGRWLRLLVLLALVTLVFFSLAATKLPHYALPALPGLALLIADRLAGSAVPPAGRPLVWSVAGTVALLLLIAAGLLATPALSEALPARIGDVARKLPGLGHPLDLGPALPAAAAAALATALAVVWTRRAPVRLAYALGSGTLVLWACVAWGVTPRWDQHFARPLRELATTALARDTDGERLVLAGLRRRPSVTFYGGRPTQYARANEPEALRALLAGPPARMALADETSFAALARTGGFELLARDTGYVLFRAAPTPPGDARAHAARATLPSARDSKP